MRINIEIVGDITIIESFNEKGYLKINNVGDKTNLQTTFDNKEVVKVINEINAKVLNGLTLPLIEQEMMRTTIKPFILDNTEGNDLKFIVELMNAKEDCHERTKDRS